MPVDLRISPVSISTPPPKVRGGGRFWWLSLAASLVLGGVVSSAAAQTTGRAQVIDGDTLEVAGQRFDLYGIDAPELGQSCQSKRNRDYDCGQLALEGLVNLTGKSPVLCRPVKGAANPTGAIWARCVVGWADVGEEQVLKGQALADPDTGGEYKRAEQAARTLNEGIWKGRFIEPWKWRQGER